MRQLIDAHAADQASDPGHAIVGGLGPARAAILLRIAAHAAELDHLEALAVQAHTFLAIEDRPTAVDRDGQHGQQHHRQADHEQGCAANDIEDALDRRAQEALVEAFAEDQPTRVDVVEPDLAEPLLEVGRDVRYPDAADLAVQ